MDMAEINERRARQEANAQTQRDEDLEAGKGGARVEEGDVVAVLPPAAILYTPPAYTAY